MKTKISLLVILITAVLLSGCVGTNALGVFDESVPEEMLSHLEIRNSLSIALFNNVPVQWSPGLTQNSVTISVPAGENSFVVTWIESHHRGGGFYDNITITANVSKEFLPGHGYRIYMQRIWLVFFTIKNVKIKEVSRPR
jgi:amino acid permease